VFGRSIFGGLLKSGNDCAALESAVGPRPPSVISAAMSALEDKSDEGRPTPTSAFDPKQSLMLLHLVAP
jgi:hypothetical protein